MTCSEIDQLWDEVLDARAAGHPGRERLIEAHAASCPRCRATAARYQALRAAIAALGPPPAPTEGFSDRFLAACREAAPRRAAVARRRSWIALTTAASLLAAAWLGTRAVGPRPGPRPGARRPEIRLHLASAFLGATSATIDLARGVSAPAARIGRDVLDLRGAEFARAEIAPGAVRATGPASDLLRSVGERIDAGARPLTGSARHAFGFLLPPDADARRRPTAPDADDGVD